MASVPWAGTSAAGAVAVKIDVRNPGSQELAGYLGIKNNGLTQLQISLDNAKTYPVTIEVGENLSLPKITMDSFYVKTAGPVGAVMWVAVDKEED